MQRGGITSFTLVPDSGVETVDGKTFATAVPAWMRLEPAALIRAGAWMRLRYRRSMFDNNVRPLIRITDNTGQSRVQAMNGTMFGTGEWVCYVPDNVSSIAISPAASIGEFAFEIESVDFISPVDLFKRGLKAQPHLILRWLDAWVRGARDEARRALRFAGSATEFADYDRWARGLARAAEPEGIDRPRSDWTATPMVRVFAHIDATSPFEPTMNSLIAQVYPRWCLHYRIDGAVEAGRRDDIRSALKADARCIEIQAGRSLSGVGCGPDDICAVVEAGDVFPDYALAVVAERFAARPAIAMIYGDSDCIALSSGRLHSPGLLPDWSPIFEAAYGYVSRPVWIRADAAVRDMTPGAFIAQHDAIVTEALSSATPGSVHHERRVLCHRAGEPATPQAPRIVRKPQPEKAPIQYPDVSVIIPSRDNADCLSVCMDGLLRGTDYPNLRVTMVDNGSVKPDALALLRDLRKDPRVDVLERPGPFNYAAICNDAVRASNGPMLVLLNDDIEMRDPDWLKPMVRWALRPDVGVVGAKLLFPSGKIQHAGVVVGLGGIAAHLYHLGDADQAGYLGRLTAPHELTAVTAACIAIERRKFDAVGGFDAENLPVDLNDIDLCLRLDRAGYVSLWTPEAVLVHHESASRGRSAWSSQVYRKERTYFVDRWQEAIRDDRYFHPDLSLFSYRPALG